MYACSRRLWHCADSTTTTTNNNNNDNDDDTNDNNNNNVQVLAAAASPRCVGCLKWRFLHVWILPVLTMAS